MYTATMDAITILDARSQILIDDPILELADNTAGSFSFVIYNDNPGYGKWKMLKSIITVKWENEILFRGRVISAEKDFDMGVRITAEGELAYLADTIQMPKEYHEASVYSYLSKLLAVHNEQAGDDKQIRLGSVTVTNPTDQVYKYTNWESTLDVLQTDLLDTFGGHFRIRYSESYRYLDYLEDYPRLSGQKIEFGENLMSYTETTSAMDIATVCIPLGAKQEESSIEALEERLTIKSVNNDKDYIELSSAINNYGRIVRTVTWDDVNTPSILLSKGNKWLQDNQYANLELTLTAVDLADFGVNTDHLRILDRVRCTSSPHGMDREFPLTAMTLHLLNPEQNVYTLGSKQKTFSQSVGSSQKTFQAKFENSPSKSNVLKQALDNATQLITMVGKDGHVIFSPSVSQPNELFITDYDSLEEAQRCWRWNLNGLGYSSNGVDGPFDLAITMDGTIAGKFIAAGTIGADQINVAYTVNQEKKWQDELGNSYWTSTVTQSKISNAIDTITLAVTEYVDDNLSDYYTKSEINVTVNGINSTVSKKVGSSEIISKINQSAEGIKISADKVNIKASDFRVQATKLSWKSTNSEMSESGILKCSGAELAGTMKAGYDSWYWVKLSGQGQMTGGKGSEQYGYIDYSASMYDLSTGYDLHGIQIQGGSLRISVPKISVAATSNTDVTTYHGATRTVSYISKVEALSDGGVQWWTSSMEFINGIMVTGS